MYDTEQNNVMGIFIILKDLNEFKFHIVRIIIIIYLHSIDLV
jgi:hypothetical protein